MKSSQPEIRSLEDLYDAYKNQIYTLCIRLAGSKVLADDLFGETWTKVAERYGNIKHNNNPMAWVYTVCINIYRKSAAKWEKTVLQADALSPDNLITNTIKSNEADAEESLIKQETEMSLQKALSGLNDKYRVPIVLFYFRDLSYDDIAGIMKIPLSTVKFRLNHAKELLKKEMEAHK